MKRGSYRPQRVAELIKQEISRLLTFELKDPRLHDCVVTIMDVDITRDLSYAKIFISIFEEDKVAGVMAAFESSKGFIKRAIGSNLSLRIVPEIDFVHDTSIKDGMRLAKLIENINKEDDEAVDS